MTEIALTNNEIIIGLINDAKAKHGKIYPCINQKSLESGTTIINNKIQLWYNDRFGSTHIVQKEIKQ